MASKPLKEDPKETDPVVSSPKRSAVGVPSLLASIPLALNDMGPVWAAKTLLRMNQKDGFDCPSCAWPDPPHRETAEFCGNGVQGRVLGGRSADGAPRILGREPRSGVLRSHDQFNTTTYSLNDKYRGVHKGRNVLFVNAADLAALGLADGSYADVHSVAPDRVDRVLRRLRIISYPRP
nr:molybdopterin dinucleotide binding domain-containing protein [Paeniglutamicibacter gangotriensis]